MQLQDMVTRVRKTLGEPEPNGYGSQQAGQGTWDNSQIIGYMNEALGIMAREWRKEKLGSITVTTAGQTAFTFPADMIEDGLRALSYVTGGTAYPVRFIDLDTYNRYATGGVPAMTGTTYNYVYTVWAGQILLWPGAASVTDTLQPYYFHLPATLVNGGDIPEIPARFHQAPIFYAIRECQNAVEEANLEYDANGKWETELRRFRIEMSRNNRDQGIRARGRR